MQLDNRLCNQLPSCTTGHTLLPGRQPDARRAVQLGNRAMESCSVRQPGARRAVRLDNRVMESCAVRQPGDGEPPGWTTRRVESCPVRQLGMSLANNTIIMFINAVYNNNAIGQPENLAKMHLSDI